MKSQWALLLLGVSLLLGSPVIVMMPEFTPPAGITTITLSTSINPLTITATSGITNATKTTNGTSTVSALTISPANFPNVTFPFIAVGVVVGVIGLSLVILGYIRLQRVRQRRITTWPLGSIGLVLVLVGFFLMGYSVRGDGWAILLYEAQGVYLFGLGIAVVLYAILSIWAAHRSAIMLSVGILLAGFSLLGFNIENSELELRCNVEVGCNALLARSTVLGVVTLGLLLAFATFIIGYGIAAFRKRN